jgi:hypothetical protein
MHRWLVRVAPCAVVAAVLAACGGRPALKDLDWDQDAAPVDAQRDVAWYDSSHTPDGRRWDAGQQDAPQWDAGGSCVPSGGRALGEVCINALPCACPNQCADPDEPPYAGSCWPLAGAAGCADPSDTVLPVGAAAVGYCVPTAPITGSFAVPISSDVTPGGTASVSVTIHGVSYAFTQGWATHDTTGAQWLVYLTTGSIVLPTTYLIFAIMDPYYQTIAPVSLDMTSTDGYLGLYYQTNSLVEVRGWNLSGYLQLTKASTTEGGTVAGTLNGARIHGYVMELCGPHTEPC